MTMKRGGWLAFCFAVSVSFSPAAPASAQLGTGRTITIVVPIGAGGGVDATGRLIAEKLQERLKQPVVVENRPAGGGMVGTDSVAKAAPDGQTLLLMESSAVLHKWLHKAVPYDVVVDFQPIARVAISPLILIANSSFAPNNAREMIALAKARPGQLFYASSGHGTSPHLSMELFSLMAGIKMIQVPYKSSGPGVIDLLAGQVALMAPSMISGIPHVRSGKLRALGVTTAQRSPSAPDIPTVAESGVPGYESAQWYGLLAPAATPKDILEKLHREVTAVLFAPEHRELLGAEGGIVVAGTPEAFTAVIRAETAKWLRVAKDAGLKPE